jgi:hypothetical protein
MCKAITSIFCCLAVFGASAGDPHKLGPSVLDFQLQQPAAQKSPVFVEGAGTRPVEGMTEAEIRAEIDAREQRMDAAKKTLKQMIAARDFAGGTDLVRAAELDKRRVSLLKKQLKEKKEKASSSSATAANTQGAPVSNQSAPAK